MREGKLDLQQKRAAINKKNIDISFIDSDPEYIFVKPIEPPHNGGAKALKNEDFIDHTDYKNRYAYYKQVTIKNIHNKYITKAQQQKEQTVDDENPKKNIEVKDVFSGYSPSEDQNIRFDGKKSLGFGYMVSYEIPETLNKHRMSMLYKNYEHREMFVEFRFFGPLLNPVVVNESTGKSFGINCCLAKDQEISVDTSTREIWGIDDPQIANGSDFWSLCLSDNKICLSADDGIKSGGSVRISTRYDMINT